MDESSRAEFIDESMIGLLALNLECTSEWRRKKAEQYPNDNRNLAAAEKLSELASQVRQLKGSPLHLEFDNFHRQLLDKPGFPSAPSWRGLPVEEGTTQRVVGCAGS